MQIIDPPPTYCQYSILHIFARAHQAVDQKLWMWLQNNLAGVNAIGYMYASGQGVSRDYSVAKAKFEYAAKHGDPYGTFNLGAMYMGGWGVRRNATLAAHLFAQAAGAQHIAGLFQVSVDARDSSHQ